MMPGDRRLQQRRNSTRARESVAVTRVSVRKIDSVAPMGSAPSVQAIFGVRDRKNPRSMGNSRRLVRVHSLIEGYSLRHAFCLVIV